MKFILVIIWILQNNVNEINLTNEK